MCGLLPLNTQLAPRLEFLNAMYSLVLLPL